MGRYSAVPALFVSAGRLALQIGYIPCLIPIYNAQIYLFATTSSKNSIE